MGACGSETDISKMETNDCELNKKMVTSLEDVLQEQRHREKVNKKKIFHTVDQSAK